MQGWEEYYYDDVYEYLIVLGCKSFQISNKNLKLEFSV